MSWEEVSSSSQRQCSRVVHNGPKNRFCSKNLDYLGAVAITKVTNITDTLEPTVGSCCLTLAVAAATSRYPKFMCVFYYFIFEFLTIVRLYIRLNKSLDT